MIVTIVVVMIVVVIVVVLGILLATNFYTPPYIPLNSNQNTERGCDPCLIVRGKKLQVHEIQRHAHDLEFLPGAA